MQDHEVIESEEEDPVESDRNLLDRIRAKRLELAERRSTYITVPGYEDIGLVVQYHLLDGKELDRIAEKVKRQMRDRVDRGLNAAADTLIAACDGFFLDKGSSEYAPFDPGNRGAPLRYEKELAEFLGVEEVATARDVVFMIFADNDVALANHAMKLNRWFTNTSRDADEEFLGEA